MIGRNRSLNMFTSIVPRSVNIFLSHREHQVEVKEIYHNINITYNDQMSIISGTISSWPIK